MEGTLKIARGDVSSVCVLTFKGLSVLFAQFQGFQIYLSHARATVPMLHSLKKRIGLANGSLSGQVHLPPEVLALKQKLYRVRAQVISTTSYVDKANEAIKIAINEQAIFAKAFSKGFPFGPDTLADRDSEKTVALDFSLGSEAKSQADAFASQSKRVYEQHCKSGSQDEDWAKYAAMSQQLKFYASSITALDARYPKLLLAKSECTRYSAKFDSLFSQGTSADLKLTRNLQKSDRFRDEYQRMLVEVLSEQRALHARAPLALKMALVVYWGIKDVHMELVNKTFDETTPWAKENEDELLHMEVRALDFPIAEESVFNVQGSFASSFRTYPSAD